MKDCDSRSWIFSSRYHTGQGEESAEATVGGFQWKEAIGRGCIVWILSYNFFVHVCEFQWRKSRMCTGFLKELCVHLGKCAGTWSYNST